MGKLVLGILVVRNNKDGWIYPYYIRSSEIWRWLMSEDEEYLTHLVCRCDYTWLRDQAVIRRPLEYDRREEIIKEAIMD
jgi:hypothetical protein